MKAPLTLQPPVLALHATPLAGAAPVVCRPQPGATIASLAPRGVVVCRLNGQWLLREHWQRPALPGDLIEFHELPQDKGSSRVALTIALLIVAPEIAATIYSAAGGTYVAASAATALTLIEAGVVIVGSQLINALVPIEQPTLGAGQAPSPTYSVALSGNQARPDQPIPDIYGRHLVYPDFAAQPYVSYDDDGTQYYHALLCVGQGVYTFERVTLDDTPIDHYQDVEYAHLEPGETPTLVLANVVTAPEVSGQTMATAQFVGGFAACGPTLEAASIGIDVVCPRGLGLFDGSGNVGSKSISWRVDVRTVSDFGVPLTAWETIATESLTLATVDPVRRSYTYTLDAPARVEVRLLRTDAKDENQQALHDIAWAGLRAYLNETATLCPTATHVEVRLRSSEQLNGLTQRRIAVIVRRQLRTWTPADGWSVGLEETRNPAWALANKWTATYGDGLPDSRCDLATLHAMAQVWDARQDRFDHVFDTATDSAAADQLIAGSGRARVFRRHGIRTLVRDEWDDLPVTLFGARDIVPGTLSIDYALATSQTPDGVRVEYFDNRAWDWRTVDCPAPGYTTETWQRPVTVRLPGVTGATHAEREGLKMAAETFYRRKFVSFVTELQGMLPAFGSSVLIAPQLAGFGQTGDVAAYDATTQAMTLTEPPQWSDGDDHYILLVNEDGSLTPPIRVLPGPGERTVTLLEDPGMVPVTDAPDRERTRYHLGTASVRILAKVLAIRPAGRNGEGAPQVRITCVADDLRVHQADEHLLPGPGDEQDPVTPEDGTGEAPGGSAMLVNLPAFTTRGGQSVDVVFHPDGTLTAGGVLIANMWLLGAPFEAATVAAAGLEILLGATSTPNPELVEFSGIAADTWFSLDVDRTVTVEFITQPTYDFFTYGRFFVSIRDADGVVQVANTVTVLLGETDYGGGGD